MAGIEKYKMESAIRCLFFKHRGDISRIVEESGYPLDVVRKMVAKIKRTQRHDVSYDVATNISMMIFNGREERMARRYELLEMLEEERKKLLSSCCGGPVHEFLWEGETKKTCTLCGHECAYKPNKFNFSEYRRLLNDIAKEDEYLGNFAEKMGLTFKGDPTVINNTQYNLTVQEQAAAQEKKRVESKAIEDSFDTKDKQLMGEADNLDPRTREKLRKDLEQALLEQGKDSEKNGETTEG